MRTPDLKLSEFFSEKLNNLKCRDDTKAYIISLFTKYKSADDDLSDKSITIVYAEAREKHSFAKYQNMSDWIFMTRVMFPEHLKHASPDYYRTLGKSGYLSCYKIINKTWPLFEELSEDFVKLELQSRKLLINK